MSARIDPIADRVYRISTFVPDVGPTGFTFNQFLVDADEPLLYHTGMRGLFPSVREAIEQVMPVERLRWISFSHLEADECGAVEEFFAVAPEAQVVHGELAVMLSLDDQLSRAPRALTDGEVLELGSGSGAHRVLEIATPHVPHNWESHMLFEQETETLFIGDLLTQLGDGPAVTDESILDAAILAEDVFHQTSLGAAVPETYRRLADLEPKRLAIMHGSSYDGDCATLLRDVADVYEQRYGCGTSGAAQPVPAQPAPVGAPS